MILVVGAVGALGSIVCQRLLEQGNPVRAMSREPQTLLADLKEREPRLYRATCGTRSHCGAPVMA